MGGVGIDRDQKPAAAPAWRPVLEGVAAARALEVALEVASRLADPERLAQAVESAARHGGTWYPLSLAHGNAGLAVAFGQLEAAIPGAGWDALAAEQLKLAVRGLREDGAAYSDLFAGLAGLAFAAATLGSDARYGRLLATLDRMLVTRTEQLVERVDAQKRGAAPRQINLLTGLAGIGAYFLTRAHRRGLELALAPLVRLALADETPPAWHAPPELLSEYGRRLYPGGELNCGLAHGIPGPLALLALAATSGQQVDRLAEAIGRLAAWLVEHRVDDAWGLNWAKAIPLGAGAAPPEPVPASWYYGAPGVARSLWLAGEALGDEGTRELAVAALEAVQRRPPKQRFSTAPTFALGLAGLAQITLRFAQDTGRLEAGARALLTGLVDAYEPDSILGYRDLDFDGRRVDQAGLMRGAAGTMLVLLAAATPAEPRWDRVFLLA